MPFPADCPTWIDCNEARKNLTTDMIVREMIISDANGCPALRISGEIETVPSALTNAQTLEHLIEEDDNITLLATLNAWKLANPTFKVIEKVQINSITKQSLLITYST